MSDEGTSTTDGSGYGDEGVEEFTGLYKQLPSGISPDLASISLSNDNAEFKEYVRCSFEFLKENNVTEDQINQMKIVVVQKMELSGAPTTITRAILNDLEHGATGKPTVFVTI
jgi:hypothetical protein